MTVEVNYTPNECFLLPAVIVCAIECENPECGATHGYALVLHWFWWGICINWERPHE